MRQSRGILRTRRTAAAIATTLVAASTLIVARSDDSSPADLTTIVIVALLGALVLFVLLNLGFQLAGVDGEAPEIAEHLVSQPDQQRLLTRWLSRARWARFVGGFSGLLVWFLGTSARGDVLVLGTGGIAAGAVVAELHHIRRAGGARTARLDVRSVGDYLSTKDARRMLAVALAAAVTAAVGVLSADTRTATWWGLGAIAALSVARLAQHRVATRARPAVSEALTRADDLARELAIGAGLARPATYFALALTARAFFALEPTIGGFGPALGAAAWLYALYLWWRNRRLGLDAVVAEHRDPVLV
jgi:hypothetical protein